MIIYSLLCLIIAGVPRDNASAPLLELTISAPLFAEVAGSFCSEKCQDKDKNIEASFSAGLPAISGDLALNLGFYQKSWNLFSVKIYEVTLR